MNLQQGDDYEKVELTDNNYLASYNIGLYDKAKGVLMYNENNLATQSDIFFNLINSNEALEDDFIIFSVMLNTNINNIKSFNNITFTYSNDYFVNNVNNSKEVEALMAIANNFTLENATIKIEIKSNKNGIIKKDEAKRLMQDTRLRSLTANYEDDEGNRMGYNLISSILSYKDNIENEKQKDFEACKTKIIEIHKKLFQK